MYTNLNDDPTWEQRHHANKHAKFVHEAIAGIWIAIGVALIVLAMAAVS